MLQCWNTASRGRGAQGPLDVGVVAVFRVWWRPQPARHPPGESAFRVRRPRRGHAGAPPPRVASTASPPPGTRPVRVLSACGGLNPRPRYLPGGLVARCPSGSVVQKASESHRIHPDPAKTVKPRRISDHSRAEPAENSETQTHFGPLPRGARRKQRNPDAFWIAPAQIRSGARRSRGAESAAGGRAPALG